MSALKRFVYHLAKEPPFRLFARKVVKYFFSDVRQQALWDASDRPHYLMGVLRAADQARESGVPEISVAEFGVAGGAGLLCLQDCAERVEAATGVKIHVLGFDTGSGLPKGTGDYRDHPEIWTPGDFVMDWDKLRPLLKPRTELVLGDVAETLVDFVNHKLKAPLGFMAVDVDFYSSTRDAFKILSLPGRKTLIRTVIYLDDVETMLYHRFAGELLAVDDFNLSTPGVKIDRWRGIRSQRPFHEALWLDRMYVAYDLEAIDRIGHNVKREKLVLDLSNVSNLGNIIDVVK
jgi:hypothetical protein